MRRILAQTLAIGVAVLALAGPLSADGRVALVVGMSDYASLVPLENPARDAARIGATLERVGFDVTTLIDTPAGPLRDALDEFAFRAETADLALIYFAGHGVEVQGQNYLIPVDAEVGSNRDVQRASVSLRDLMASVEGARKMRIVILDSCRDNPLDGTLDQEALAQDVAAEAATRSVGEAGLAPAAPDRGTLVAYAARHGMVALDGGGENSPYALALADALDEPGLEISLMFRQVRDRVLEMTGNLQEPHTYGSLPGTPFYLAGAAAGDSTVGAEDLRVAWSDIDGDQETKLRRLAEAGDTRSLVGLAYIRLNAADDRYAPGEAATLLTAAADGGSAEAQFELAKLYEAGLGVPQDTARALQLYRAAADQAFPDALNDLGFLHFQGGLGLTRDPKLALDYFRRAAELRQPEAMYNYASLIDDGLVEGQGPEEAAALLYRALRTGNSAVYKLLSEKPGMFKPETRKALQRELSAYAFYAGPIDGDLGPGTQRGIRAAYGLTD
ncbi:peptidase C14, caspase catalytic subunit p20 [Rhodobacteraceae bacterium CCMM004]|nr:peptidase C14, caspase catalytic subunit p20 [Rhodobacteraceae bacterium CCMM004]